MSDMGIQCYFREQTEKNRKNFYIYVFYFNFQLVNVLISSDDTRWSKVNVCFLITEIFNLF